MLVPRQRNGGKFLAPKSQCHHTANVHFVSVPALPRMANTPLTSTIVIDDTTEQVAATSFSIPGFDPKLYVKFDPNQWKTDLCTAPCCTSITAEMKKISGRSNSFQFCKKCHRHKTESFLFKFGPRRADGVTPVCNPNHICGEREACVSSEL